MTYNNLHLESLRGLIINMSKMESCFSLLLTCCSSSILYCSGWYHAVIQTWNMWVKGDAFLSPVNHIQSPGVYSFSTNILKSCLWHPIRVKKISLKCRINHVIPLRIKHKLLSMAVSNEVSKRIGLRLSPIRTSLVVQWLRLCASMAGGTGLIPGWGTKIPHAAWHSQKKKR